MPKPTKESAVYAVGYGKPPAEHRFKPGQSGNPKGRRKGSRNLATLLQEELDRPITVNQQGRARRMPRRQAVSLMLVEKALKGDIKALCQILRVEAQHALSANGPPSEGGPPAFEPPPEVYDEILEAMLKERIDENGTAGGSS